MKYKYLSCFLALFSVFASANSQASSKGPELIGEFYDWVAYSYDGPQGRVCYISSNPKKDEGRYLRRGDTYVVVTHRPADNSFDVVNFVAGYQYKRGAKVTVKIGTTTINDFFTEEDKAWTMSSRTDKVLIDEMKKGQRMIVKGISSRGNLTKDTYSLRGFSNAYKVINAKCGKR